jgi:serine/threonine-protein kinase TTK/MPS1
MENEDDSFEVPDFHFDWGVSKEKAKADGARELQEQMGILQLDRLRVPREQTPPYTAPDTHSTPQQPSGSAQSSASSIHVLALTDASTAFGSSLVPTPPGMEMPPLDRYSSLHQNAGSSGSSAAGRTYGGRSFHRVVSAPLARPRPSEEMADHDDSVRPSTKIPR